MEHEKEKRGRRGGSGVSVRRHPLCGGGIEQRGEYKGYPLLVCTKCDSAWQLVGDELHAVDRQPQRPQDLGSRHVPRHYRSTNAEIFEAMDAAEKDLESRAFHSEEWDW